MQITTIYIITTKLLVTLTNLNTEELITLCKSKNQSAQLEIYNRYYKAMYNTSIRIVKDSFEAEDIMQDAFLQAFTKLKTLKDDSTFGAWLKRIVVNKSIHHYRQLIKKNETSIDDVLYKIEESTYESEQDHNYNNLKANQVLDTMKTLKDNYRIVLTLNLIEGYDYEEIGEILNISYQNTRTMVSRAKMSLRQKLNQVARI
ncbi:RNA polymerase sigma factor [Cognatitamlana onchidii]|uniref:RNA polymerase sigma factor n=1 Tax=Cognatitamlana onchidii TaxID=2562860 RepID=UPI001F46819B|nr:RNA polymerase sigma factor [Algibacter onchidii]